MKFKTGDILIYKIDFDRNHIEYVYVTDDNVYHNNTGDIQTLELRVLTDDFANHTWTTDQTTNFKLVTSIFREEDEI